MRRLLLYSLGALAGMCLPWNVPLLNAADPTSKNAKETLAGQPKTELRESQDPRIGAGGDKFDSCLHYGGSPQEPVINPRQAMTIKAKYVHTNIVAHHWRAQAKFYQDVFGCTPLPPQRDYHGDWVGEVTGLPEASVQGMHLRLPGYDENGPTLEIFQYDRTVDGLGPAANRRGFTHIAFLVDDVAAARQAVLEAGGNDLGRLHTMEVPGAGVIKLVYMTDPEGNIIELQHWTK